mmetsp:Transcript_1082/g.1756  ORF Transcript_1082/g.1756 Transcript_1082/m.1756 type:complete len:520 (-) Transcript_1082:88-1647(-)
MVSIESGPASSSSLNIGAYGDSMGQQADVVVANPPALSQPSDLTVAPIMTLAEFTSLSDKQSLQSMPPAQEQQTLQAEVVDDVKQKPSKEITTASDSPVYQIKWLFTEGPVSSVPICLQNENGPCPLLAIVNALFLRGNITIPEGIMYITLEELVSKMTDYLMVAHQQLNDDQTDAEVKLSFQHNLQEVLALLPDLARGADINVKFTDVDSIEPTKELICFDLFKLRLLHGWLLDPAWDEMYQVLSPYSFNQLLDIIVQAQEQSSSSGVDQDAVQRLRVRSEMAQVFMESSPSQITEHGFQKLRKEVGENEVCVLFRNNHYSTMTKHDGKLYLLVSDCGYRDEIAICWEEVQDIHGNSIFTNYAFQEYKCIPSRASSTRGSRTNGSRVASFNQAKVDEELAHRLAESGMTHETDEEFARRLQREEDEILRKQREQREQQKQKQKQKQKRDYASVAAGAGSTNSSHGSSSGPPKPQGPTSSLYGSKSQAMASKASFSVPLANGPQKQGSKAENSEYCVLQ